MDTISTIKRDKMIIKFSLYGFLKNLKFFEPFLMIYLIAAGHSLLEIGFLYSIRELVTYILEVPSGILADHRGKKNELSICFLLYIVSFIFFFIGGSYAVFVVAMVFFGAGEAFRSGTHKAIILEYLEEKNWFEHKNMVYSRTRSFSLIGSSLSSFVSIIFLLQYNNLRYLFLLCIVPYLLDFILILSYPKRFNTCSINYRTFGGFVKQVVSDMKKIFSDRMLLKVVSASSLFDSIVKSIKDYIQPILQTLILTSSLIFINGWDRNETLSVSLAVVYGLLYILSSFATRSSYRLTRFRNSKVLMNVAMDILGGALVLMSLFVRFNWIYIIVLVYFAIIILKDTRRPMVIDVIGDLMDKQQRATVLSVESQIKSLLVIVFAPLFGFIADTFSISVMLLFAGIVCIAANRFLRN